jgi:hypothetical protein
MDIEEIIISIMGVVLYSGGIFPLCIVLWIQRSSRQQFCRTRKVLLILLAVQILAFVPPIILAAKDVSDWIYAFTLPALTGTLQFVGSGIYLGVVAARRWWLRAEP